MAGRLPHYAREETGFAEMLVEPHTGLLIGLHPHNANQGEKFEESRTGLDHISFEVADRAALETWMDRLDELNIGHTGIRRRPNGPYSTVVFRDPAGGSEKRSVRGNHGTVQENQDRPSYHRRPGGADMT
ncbi:MAG: VOC family protein [Trebonia sp.]